MAAKTAAEVTRLSVDDKKPEVRNKIVVGGEGENAVASLTDALKKAKPGDTIILAKANVKIPSLKLARTQFKDLIIEGTTHDGRPTVLEANGNLRFLINVDGIESIRFKNIEFDGAGKSDHCLQVSGAAPGFTVEGCTMKGAKTAAILFVNAAGTESQPLLLDKVRFQLQTRQTAVILETTGQNDTRRLTIRECRFEGVGGQVGKGIRFEAATTDVEISNNRFFSLESALYFGKPIAKTIKAQIASNTIYDSRTGLEFDLNNLAANAFDLTVRQNYFGKTPQVAQGNGGKGAVPGVTADTNAFGPDSKPGNVDLKLSQLDKPLLPAPEANNDATFLRFAGGQPELNGKKIGAP
ncbi:MAG: hypothetical protein C0467_23140 [Planctomycetaceae bacterium]|nr:hypothetical protein [Planctomycetaceae bacterium]